MVEIKKEDFISEAKGFFNSYKKQIGKAIRETGNIIFIDFDDLSSFSPVLSEQLL